jgi:hypothetical protein
LFALYRFFEGVTAILVFVAPIRPSEAVSAN